MLPYTEAKEEIAGFDAIVASGDFTPIRDWLRAKIHNVGSLHPSADELCQAVTAGPDEEKWYREFSNHISVNHYGPRAKLWCLYIHAEASVSINSVSHALDHSRRAFTVVKPPEYWV